MDIKAGSRVTIRQPQLHSRSNDLVDGSVIKIEGDKALVQVEGEHSPRQIAINKLTASASLYGSEMVDRFDHQVTDAIRRY